MRASMITLLVAIGLLLAQPAPGDIYDPEPNKLGIYFDLEFEGWYPCASATVGTMVTAYIILTNPTFGTLHRWEAAIRSTDGLLLSTSESIEGGGVNTSGSTLEFVVSYDAPIATEPVTVLATVQLFFIDLSASCLILTGVSNPSLPEDLPLVWPEVENPTVIQTTELYSNGVVASLWYCGGLPESPPDHCGQVVGVVKQNWGTLKSTYR